VYQGTDGVWELIDGLQRLSTIFEFVGVLRNEVGGLRPPTALEGTRFLPSLSDKKWASSSEDANDGIGAAQQLHIKRARMRVEILKQESDPQAKYELFQRLNTGGQNLSEQEIRNCVGVMLNPTFQEWLVGLANSPEFRETINQTDAAIERQAQVELVLRFFAFRHVTYKSGLDVHEYLDDSLVKMATNAEFNFTAESEVFVRTFLLLSVSMGDSAFKRWNGVDFTGKFLMSVFEVVALGVSKNINAIEALGKLDRRNFIRTRSQLLWQDPTFIKNSGAGVRGTSRLTNLLPLAEAFFHP